MSKRILVIDDDQGFAEMLQTALEAKGYQVDVFLQAPMAYRKIKELRPDLLTLDIMMPGRSGWEIANQLRSSPETARIPIIIITAVQGALIADEALVLSGTRYEKLPKPFALEDLYQKVERLIGKPEGDP